MVGVLHVADPINQGDWIDIFLTRCDRARFRAHGTVTGRASNIASPQFVTLGNPTLALKRLSWTQLAGCIARTAHFIRANDIKIVHTHHYREALIGAAAARLTGVRFVLGRHYDDEILITTSGLKQALLLFLERLATRTADAVVVPSTRIEALLLDQGTPAQKVHVIPYPIDVDDPHISIVTPAERAAVRRELDLDGEYVIGNVARHAPVKGQGELLEAFARFVKDVPRARLLLVGEGALTEPLKARAAALGIYRETDRESPTRFLGWRRDAKRLLAAFDVVVHPTRQEALPQIMVETMARGLPLIIGDVSGVRDQMQHLHTGFILASPKAGEIAAALEWMQARPDQAAAMGRQAACSIRAALDWRLVVPRTETLYQRLLAETA